MHPIIPPFKLSHGTLQSHVSTQGRPLQNLLENEELLPVNILFQSYCTKRQRAIFFTKRQNNAVQNPPFILL